MQTHIVEDSSALYKGDAVDGGSYLTAAQRLCALFLL